MDDGNEKQKIHPRLITILMIIEGMTMRWKEKLKRYDSLHKHGPPSPHRKKGYR